MKLNFRIIGIIALLAMVVYTFTACSSKKDSSNSAAKASDFEYRPTEDGRGITITYYNGKGGDVVIPAKIDGKPVLEIFANLFNPSFHNHDADILNAITSIVVPDSVEVIGDGAFGVMRNLTKVTLPDGIKVIPFGAFDGSEKLVSVNLPASLEEIGIAAFSGCSELSELIIPATLISVKFHLDGENYAFRDCDKLPAETRKIIQSLGYWEENRYVGFDYF